MPKIKNTVSSQKRRAQTIEEISEKLCQDICGAVGEIRGRKRLTQAEFAKMAGLPASTFSKRLKNANDFELGEIIKIIAAFPEIRENLANSISTL